MPPISYLLLAFVLPAIIVLAGMFSWRWLTAIIFPLAFVVAEWEIHGLPHGPPGSGGVVDWIVWFTIPLAILGLFSSLLLRRNAIALPIVFVLSLAAVHLLLGRLSFADRPLIEVAIAATMTVYWLSISPLIDRSPGITVPLILIIQCLGGAVLLGTENTLVTAHGAGALTAMSTAALVAILLRKKAAVTRGPVLTISFCLMELLVYGHFYTYPDLPNSSYAYAAILLLAPLLAWAGDIPIIRKSPAPLRLVVRILPVLLAVGSAAALSVHDYLSTQSASQNTSGGEEEY